MGASQGSFKAISRTHCHSSASTNDEAKLLAQSGAKHFTLVTADIQTAGRGRFDRHWISPPGNIYASLILRPEKTWPDIGQCGHLTALALHEAIQSFLPTHSVTLKWPNDILVEGQKISGILIETGNMRVEGAKATADYLIIGMGVNVLSHPKNDMAYPVTSLAANALQPVPDKEEVLSVLMSAFQQRLATWMASGFSSLRQDYLRVADRLGERITVRNGQTTATGIYETINDHGALILRDDDENVITISAGDVLRPA